jgi:hypothetical protein
VLPDDDVVREAGFAAQRFDGFGDGHGKRG